MKINSKEFLLDTETSQRLYERNKNVPIFDFHCHLDPKEIYTNEHFENITQLWLKHDHYKWRLMRAFGIEENRITGDASDFDKFEAFINMLKYALINPMYHWCALELNQYFNININFEEIDAESLYIEMNNKLKTDELLPRNILKMSNVEAICTTDDPFDDLKYHELLSNDETFDVKVLPTFRPDAYIDFVHINLNATIEEIKIKSNKSISSLSDYLDVLLERVDYFKEHGCVASDHSFNQVPEVELGDEEASNLFDSIKNGENVEDSKKSKMTAYIFSKLSVKYKEHNFVTQLHLGPIRNNNTKMFNTIGKDAGFDSIGNELNMKHLNEFLDYLETNGALTDTIIYPNNSNDHLKVQSAAGNFNNSEHKIQLGAAWWYNDTKEGMEQHIIDYANVGLLSNFVGMLTDSRSLLSFTRHDYFRRILCNQLGIRIEKGEITDNVEYISSIVKDICFNNAIRLFNLKLEEEQ